MDEPHRFVIGPSELRDLLEELYQLQQTDSGTLILPDGAAEALRNGIIQVMND